MPTPFICLPIYFKIIVIFVTLMGELVEYEISKMGATVIRLLIFYQVFLILGLILFVTFIYLSMFTNEIIWCNLDLLLIIFYDFDMY